MLIAKHIYGRLENTQRDTLFVKEKKDSFSTQPNLLFILIFLIKYPSDELNN